MRRFHFRVASSSAFRADAGVVVRAMRAVFYALWDWEYQEKIEYELLEGEHAERAVLTIKGPGLPLLCPVGSVPSTHYVACACVWVLVCAGEGQGEVGKCAYVFACDPFKHYVIGRRGTETSVSVLILNACAPLRRALCVCCAEEKADGSSEKVPLIKPHVKGETARCLSIFFAVQERGALPF